jgi:carboxypeptidase family protein
VNSYGNWSARARWGVVLALALAVAMFFVPNVLAQSVVSGEIFGTVIDPTGAVAPNASVILSSSETGFKAETTTGDIGTFRFALVKPGNYTLTVKLSGFATVNRPVVVALGQVTNVSVQLEVGKASESIEVTGESPLLHTENANLATTWSQKNVELLPSPGQDITNYALVSPGVSVSTGAGYGNFSAYGLPGTSNLYTVNGNDYNDPYLNLNNSGASNLLLGANELQEISVVNNGYTGEYGRQAGANINYSTKSGTNKFHGNAAWYWNGNYLNANDWFNNSTSPATPRPHEVSNQWAGSFGGPIIKNKVFFFYDNEGLRYVLPGGGGAVFVPTTAFANATLAHVPASETAFYTKMFDLYAGAPGISRAVPVDSSTDSTLGCGDLAGNLGTFGVTTPCAQTFRSTVNNLNKERLMAVTVDVNATSTDLLKFRYKQDRGVQATGTDPINSIFNANSVQPEDDGQVTWTHIFNGQMTNQFIAAGLYYSALFGPPNISASLAAFPTTIVFNDGLYNNMGGTDYNYPQGRNVAQYQFVDDFSWTKGRHGIKFGVNFRRNNISSFASGPLTSGQVVENSMTDFYNGVVSAAGGGTFTQRFANAKEQPISYYSLGLYIQDEWRINSKLKLTLALRADRNSPEICHHNCFARLASPFGQLDHSVSIPYNQAVLTALHQAFPNLEAIAWGPRGGFAWTPTSRSDFVIRGGFGLFSDLYPGFLADRFITNLPNVTSFTISGSATNDNIPIAPGVAGSVFTQTSASNAALQNAFSSGGTLADILSVLPNFNVPNFNSVANNVSNPKYLEWNLQIEKSFGGKTVISANYVGNHGYDLFVPSTAKNAYCNPAFTYPAAPTSGVATKTYACPGTTFGSLPNAVPDARFANVTEISNSGVSNYNGVTFTLTRRFLKGFSGSANYTYSHTLDDLSNGGLLPFSTNAGGDSFRTQIDPNNLHHPNYGNSDYDFRHTFSASYYWELPFKSTGWRDQVIGGWAFAGTFFRRGGEPFSVYNTVLRSKLGNATNDIILGVFSGGPTTCGSAAASTDSVVPCLSASNFGTISTVSTDSTGAHSISLSQLEFANVSRNNFRGPGYFNSDFAVFKSFPISEGGMKLTLSANAFNVFNHPNFGNPVGSVTSGLFGQILNTVTPPNSPYGNFQGAAVSGRVLQLAMKFQF